MDPLREKIASFSACPAGRPIDREPGEVVLATEGVALEQAFARARALLAEPGTERVRVVGHAATLATAWPPCAAEEPRLETAELGAYEVDDVTEATAPLRRELGAWLEEVFAGAVPGVPAAEALYFPLCNRLVQPLIDGLPIIQGLARAHPRARFHVLDGRWVGLEVLRGLVAQGSVEPPAAATRAWPLRLLAAVGLALLGTAAHQGRAHLRARRSRARLAAQRRAAPAVSPDLWIALTPDWERINHHVIEDLGRPRLERGQPTGVLLFNTLVDGRRGEAGLAHERTADLWPGLGTLRDHLDGSPVDQVVADETAGGLLRSLLGGALATARAAARLAGRPPLVARGALRLDLGARLLPLAKVLTLDLLRARVAARATRAAIARHGFAGARVVFASSASSPVADRLLQEAGATTVEYFHGTGDIHWLGHAECRSSLRVLWTRADARRVERNGQRALVAGMPHRLSRRPRSAGRRVLFLSNYAHRDSRIGGSYPFEPFQEELLRVALLLQRSNDGLELRWRPHPSDAEEAVRRTIARLRLERVELSRERELAEDLAWADLVISSFSSVAVVALLSGAPVFLQHTPMTRDHEVVTFFSAGRRFFRAAEAAEPIARCLAALEAGDPAALAPEEEARRAFFGPTGEPIPLEEALRSLG